MPAWSRTLPPAKKKRSSLSPFFLCRGRVRLSLNFIRLLRKPLNGSKQSDEFQARYGYPYFNNSQPHFFSQKPWGRGWIIPYLLLRLTQNLPILLLLLPYRPISKWQLLMGKWAISVWWAPSNFNYSSNNSRGDYFFFSHQKGAIISNIAHWKSCPKYFVLLKKNNHIK